jgi:WD40 repeat protein
MQKLSFVLFMLSLSMMSDHAHGAPPTAPITALAISPDGKFLLAGSQNGIEVRSLSVPGEATSLQTTLEHVHDLRFSPNGESLLAAGGSPAEFGAVEIWHWPSRSKSKTVKTHDDLVYRVAWTTDGSLWASAGWDGVCCVFHVAAVQPLTIYRGHSRPLLTIDFVPDDSSRASDGPLLVSGGIEGTIQVWRAMEGSLVRSLSNHVGIINDLAFSPQISDESPPMLASISEDQTVRLWQPSNGRLVRFAKLSAKPKCLVWHIDGRQLLVACEDGTVRWHDSATLNELRRVQYFDHAITSIALSPTDQKIFVGNARGDLK